MSERFAILAVLDEVVRTADNEDIRVEAATAASDLLEAPLDPLDASALSALCQGRILARRYQHLCLNE